MGDEVESTTGGVFEDPLATRINVKYRELESLARSTVEVAVELGGMLLEKKSALPHGEWLPWVRAYFEGSERQAERFMQIYNNRDKLRANSTRVADMSLRQALRITSPPPKKEQEEDSTKSTDPLFVKKLKATVKAMDLNCGFAGSGTSGAIPQPEATPEWTESYQETGVRGEPALSSEMDEGQRTEAMGDLLEQVISRIQALQAVLG